MSGTPLDYTVLYPVAENLINLRAALEAASQKRDAAASAYFANLAEALEGMVNDLSDGKVPYEHGNHFKTLVLEFGNRTQKLKRVANLKKVHLDLTLAFGDAKYIDWQVLTEQGYGLPPHKRTVTKKWLNDMRRAIGVLRALRDLLQPIR